MDRLLALLAAGVWVVAGAPRVVGMAERGPSATDAAWVAAYLLFAVALALALRAASGPRALAFTIVQSACALVLLGLGMPHFEGALLAVVGAQTLLVTRAPIALAWVLGQSVPLFLTVLPTHHVLGATKATGEYLAFSLFAMAVFALRERERRQRLAMLRVQAELLGTRALLRDTVATAEQDRIRRELHDSLGHHLAAASAHLDAARLADPDVHLARAREALDRLVAESRAAIGGMRPRIDLTEAMGALRGSIPGLRLELSLDAIGHVGADAAWTLFRAVQEAMTNAHRHASASVVRVSAERSAEAVRVRIENDGAPPPVPPREGEGLRSMRARVRDAGGELTLDRGPPFVLVITLPMEDEA